MTSKKIMEKHNEIPRSGGSMESKQQVHLENYEPAEVKYNIPQEFLTEVKEIPMPKTPEKDRIMSSKLPDEIKRLMIENPIVQPSQQTNPVLSEELIQKASRLMGTEKQVKRQPAGNISEMKSMLKEVVTEVLIENGIISETIKNTNDLFTFRSGNYIFEGKVTKIRKVKKS